MQSVAARWINKFIPFCALKGLFVDLSWAFSPKTKLRKLMTLPLMLKMRFSQK